MKAFSFCEGSWASGLSRWHIRELKTGRKLGGGVDSPSLCGRVKDGWGWDLSVPLTEHHLGHACPACVKIYQGRS